MSTSKPTYDNEDLNLRLRQASGAGDLAEVSRLIENNSLDINAAGLKSGQTALHRAATGGHYKVCEYLISQGADARITDKARKDPAQLATTEPLKTFLTASYPLQQASLFAQEMFPMPSSDDPDFVKTLNFRKNLNATIANDFPIFMHKIGTTINSYVSSNPEWLTQKHKDQIDEHFAYTQAIFNLPSVLEKAKKTSFNIGHCGERSIAATAFLIANNFPYNMDIIQMNTSNSNESHQFLLIGHPSKTPMDNIKSSNAIICDPYYNRNSIYSIQHIPEGTSVRGIDNSLSHYYNEPIITNYNPPSGKDFIFRADFEKIWERQIAKICELVPLIEPIKAAGPAFASVYR